MELLLRKMSLMIIFHLKQKNVEIKQQFQTEYVSNFKGVIRKSSKGEYKMSLFFTILIYCFALFCYYSDY
jgi:hypothetical protein